MEEENGIEDDEEEDIDFHFYHSYPNEIMSAFNTIRREFQRVENVPDDIFNSLNKCERFII